jgi:L-lysine 2,3-aminomutase
MHCRYCFRRHFPYDELPRSVADWQPAIDQFMRLRERFLLYDE